MFRAPNLFEVLLYGLTMNALVKREIKAGRELDQAGNHQRAREHYKQLVKNCPRKFDSDEFGTEIWFGRAQFLYKLEKYDETLFSLDKAESFANSKKVSRQIDEAIRHVKFCKKAAKNKTAKIKWSFTNRSSDVVHLKFYSEDREGYVWPSPDRVYVIQRGERVAYNLDGIRGEKICYGAWNPDKRGYWGVGNKLSNGCKNCCQTLSSKKNEHSTNLDA